jgi:hypothetical protein
MNRCAQIGRTGMGCSEAAGHAGDHIARNDGRVVDRWPGKAKPPAKRSTAK